MRHVLARLCVVVVAALPRLCGQPANSASTVNPDITPACRGYSGWNSQTNPPTDPTGLNNFSYPEGSSSTYLSVTLVQPPGTVVTIHGQYPLCRFMSLQLTQGDKLVDSINDYQIIPDPGQNNPFVSGTANGTYTVYAVFGPKPTNPALNTLYAGTLGTVGFTYRMYHLTNRNDPSGGATNPVTPQITVNDTLLANCPIQPLVTPSTSTAWGRLGLVNWHGTVPTAAQQLPTRNPVTWAINNPASSNYSPNGAAFYMAAILSRQYLAPNTSNQVFVVTFQAPTFPNVRAGEPPYTPRQVRFWSLCTDDPYSTGVTRCAPDDTAVISPSGYTTFVISDPGSKPSAAALSQFYASWIPWGALDLSTDVVYDRHQQSWGQSSPVFYYNKLLYRQTVADPSFTQSMQAVSALPIPEQQAAMGTYWPLSGYCSKAAFEASGSNCFRP